MLSAPSPSLAAKFVGHILSIIAPKIPGNPLREGFEGDFDPLSYFLGDPEEPRPFFVGELVPAFSAGDSDLLIILL